MSRQASNLQARKITGDGEESAKLKPEESTSDFFCRSVEISQEIHEVQVDKVDNGRKPVATARSCDSTPGKFMGTTAPPFSESLYERIAKDKPL